MKYITSTMQHQGRPRRIWCCSFMVLLTLSMLHPVSAQTDSLRLPDRAVGALADTGDAARADILTKQRIRLYQFESLGDLLRTSSMFLPMRNGGFGQYDAISVLGGGPQHLSIGLDARPLLDLWSGQFNLLQQPPSTIERIEFLYGSDAIGLAPTATASLYNLQSVVYNTATPFMSMWYHQGAGDLVAANVTFAQNVAPGLNVAASIRRSGARGRYQRTDFGMWNVDLTARWTVDERQSLLVRYGLTTLTTQIWGGLDPSGTSSAVDQLATVRYDGPDALEEQTRRHDLTATYHRKLAQDSTSVLTLQGYVSGQTLHRLQGVGLAVQPSDTLGVLHADGQHTGLVGRFDQRLGSLRVRFGAHLQSRSFDSTTRSPELSDLQADIFAHGEYRLGALLLRLAARSHTVLAQQRVALGGGATYATQAFTARVDLSSYTQEPTPVQRQFVSQPEQHTLAVVDLWLPGELLRLRAYHRTIANAIDMLPGSGSPLITFVPGGERRLIGAGLQSFLPWGNIELRTRVRMEQQLGAEDTIASSFTMFDADVAYVFRTPSNSVRIGLVGSWLPASRLPSYEPLVWSFRQGVGQAPSQIDGLSVYLTALVGNASVRASYENILGNPWYTVLNAPELSRVFRLSVDWSFTD
ncbi:MAG: TonB-dependent Receptor Plug Domain [Bacteroidota bacterium]